METYKTALKTLLNSNNNINPEELSYKSVFGAIAGYVQNKIFISSGKFGIAIKVTPETRNNLIEKYGAKPFKYFPKGHIKQDYALLTNDILSNNKLMKKIIEDSILFVKENSKERPSLL